MRKKSRLCNLPSFEIVNIEPIVSFLDMHVLANFGYLLNKPFANGCSISVSFTPLKQQPNASITIDSEILALSFNSTTISFINL